MAVAEGELEGGEEMEGIYNETDDSEDDVGEEARTRTRMRTMPTMLV